MCTVQYSPSKNVRKVFVFVVGKYYVFVVGMAGMVGMLVRMWWDGGL